MLEQLPPSVSQRRQTYSKPVGLPVHWPSRAVSVEPTCAVPLIVGGVWFVGLAFVAAAPGPVSISMAAARTAVTASTPIGASLRRSFLIGLTSRDVDCRDTTRPGYPLPGLGNPSVTSPHGFLTNGSLRPAACVYVRQSPVRPSQHPTLKRHRGHW